MDETIVDLMLWVEAKEQERTIGKASERQPKKGEQWVPKYASVADILAEYGDSEPDAPVVPQDEIDALIASLDAQVEPAF